MKMTILRAVDAPPAPSPGASPSPAPAAPAPSAPAAAPSSPSSTTVTRPRPTVSAAKALGLPEAPSKSAAALVRAEGRRPSNGPSSFLPPSPTRAPDGRFQPAAPNAVPTPEPNPTPLVEPAPTAPAAAAPPAPAAAPAPDPRDALITKLQTDLEEVKQKLNPATTPAPAPAAPVAPETPEQKAAREAQVRQAELTWIKDRAATVNAPELTAEQIDVINSGGPDAVKMLTEIRRGDIAAATLEARKSIYGEMNPLLDRIQRENSILMTAHMQLEQHHVEQQFMATYPDMVPQIDTCRSVAQQLLQRFPKECAAMTREQFLAETKRQADHVLDLRAQQFGYPNWRSLPAAHQVPAPAAPAPGAPPASAAPVPPQQVPPVPAAPVPAAPQPRPPVSHAPTGPVGARQPKSWQAGVAASLREP